MARRPLLRYLRDDLRMRGTKDGCSEGQCGACMVAVSCEDGGQYRAVNACIRLLGTLHGRSVLTIEGVRGSGETSFSEDLHPAQRSMLEAAASQCGFCTPGFVVSLLCLFGSHQRPTADEIHYALAGNLCRCTGYRAILEAARSLTGTDVGNQTPSPRQSAAYGARLSAPGFHSPRSTEELEACLVQEPEARLIAGGTDLAVDVWRRRGEFPSLIYLGRVRDLRQIREHVDHIEIGAAVSIVRAAAALVAQYPKLAEVFRRFSSVPIANVATLGGSVASGSPVADTIPLLIALGASLDLRQGLRSRSVSLESFCTGYRQTLLERGEYIASIRVPKPSPAQQVRAYKVTRRFEQDIAMVLGAFSLHLDDGSVTSARICYGAISDAPHRALHVEKALLNRVLDQSTVGACYDALDEDYEPVSDLYASADYRRRVARNMLMKLSVDLAGTEPVSLWASDS